MNIKRDAHAVLERLTEGLRNNHPTYLLRTYVSSAGIGLNEQKDHAEGKLGFQSWENRRKGIVVIHLHSYLFHGNELITLPKCNPSFVIRRVHAGKTTRLARHQVVILFTLFTIGGFQAGAVGEDPQRRISCICQGAVGVLKVVVCLAGATTRMVPMRAEAVATALRLALSRCASLRA